MSLSTYAGLQAAVALELGKRSDLTAQIVDWIYMVEQELNLVLERREMEQRAVANTVADQASYALPTDLGTAHSLHVNTTPVTMLEPSDWDRIATSFSTTGQPRYACINSNEFLLGPTPDAAYQIELYYAKVVQNLTVTNTSNWLLTKHPNVYYYGTLERAARSNAVETTRGAIYAAAFRDAVDKLVRHQVKERGFGGGPVLIPDIPFGMNNRPVSILTDQ